MFFDWNEDKNQELLRERGVCFEDVVYLIANGQVIDIKPHHKPEKYPNQQVFVLPINDYVYYVPFIEEEDKIFLKTIIPSRKLTKEYL